MATKEKLNIDNLPVTIDGKIEMVPKRQYCNHMAVTLSMKTKIDIKKNNVSDILDMIVAGKELEDGNEPVWFDVYKKLKEDIDLGQEKNREAIEEANQKTAEEAKAKEEKDAEEKRLVEVAQKTDVALTFSSLSENFDLGNMDRCVANEGVTDDQIMEALAAGLKMDNFSNWAKGDLVAELEKRGHENAMVTLCEQTGIPYKSIYRMATTARNVPPDNRLSGVSFTTYAEVANARFSKDETANQKLLTQTIEKIGEKTGNEKKDTAIINTAQEARKAVRTAQGKTAPLPPDPMAVDLEKHDFLIVRDGSLSASKGFPFSVAGETDCSIIHLKTARVCYDEKGKKWTPIEKHEEPVKEPEPDKEPAKNNSKKKDEQAAAPAVAPKATSPNAKVADKPAAQAKRGTAPSLSGARK